MAAQVLDGIRSLIGVQDADGRYLFVNIALAEFHGLPCSAFIGKTALQLSLVEPPRSAPQSVGSEVAIDRDVDLTDATGRHRRFDIVRRTVRSDENRSRYLLEVATETTLGDAVADERLAAAEQRLALALANGKLGLVDWDMEGDRVAPNAALCKLLEMDDPARASTGAALTGFLDNRDKARVMSDWQQHFDGRAADFHCEFRMKTARGRLRWVLANGRIEQRADDGRPLRYLGTLQDITESVETAQELDRQLVRSREATLVSTELAGEVKQLEAEIREISQREQERIGHDLHDGLGQELTGVSLLLKTLEDAIERDAPQLRSRVRSVREMVEQSIATARALAHGLSPVHLDRDGVAGALGASRGR